MLKKDELAKPTSCLNKAGAKEPIFVLRANDPHAPQTVRHWATMSEGHHEPDKIKEANAIADQMDSWWRAKGAPKAPPPIVFGSNEGADVRPTAPQLPRGDR